MKTVKRPLSKETKASLKDKILIPGNCKEFSCPKVNQEIWRQLPHHAKINDLKHQQNQQTLSMALSSFAMIANNLAENKAKIPGDVVTSTVQLAIDGSNVIGDQFQAISNARRMEIRKFLSPEYMDICNLKVISRKNL